MATPSQINRLCTFALPPITRPPKPHNVPTETSPAPAAAPSAPPRSQPRSTITPAPSVATHPAPSPPPPALTASALQTATTLAAPTVQPAPSLRPGTASSGSSSGRTSRPQSGMAVSLDRGLPADWEPSAVTTTLTDDLFSHNTVGQSRQVSNQLGEGGCVAIELTCWGGRSRVIKTGACSSPSTLVHPVSPLTNFCQNEASY